MPPNKKRSLPPVSISLRRHFQIPLKNQTLCLGPVTRIMGVVNLTPDSFSRDGLAIRSTKDISRAVTYALKLIGEGADIIDIGGESSRPGAQQITIDEEIRRVIPVIKALRARTMVPISVDTYKPPVAARALTAGASIVNNIRGANLTRAMLRVIKDHDAAIVLMHMRGTPRTMQTHIAYRDLIGEITRQLQRSAEKCLDFGIKSDKIIIDPGIGFGKTVGHNLEILRRLSSFSSLGYPILIGTSRKSFIGKILNKEAPERLWGTAASVCAAILNGAHIIRVHDVAEMSDVARMTDAMIV